MQVYCAVAVLPLIARTIVPPGAVPLASVIVPESVTHPQSAVFACPKSSVILGTLQCTIFRDVPPHTRVLLSAAEHTHQFAGHAARAPSHVALRLLLLTFITGPAIVLVHSPRVFITAAPGLPSPHNFIAGPMLPITVSTYVLFTASRPEVGVATLSILLFAISSDLRIVVVPFTSRRVAGDAVRMPTLPVASVKRLRTDVPIVPDGGEANVQPASAVAHTTMITESCFFISVRTAPNRRRITCVLFGRISAACDAYGFRHTVVRRGYVAYPCPVTGSFYA